MAALTVQFDGVWKSFPRWLAGRRSLRAMATPGMRSASRRSGTRWALRDVSFELRQGESLGLIGENGAGKSTLLRLASGLGRVTKGEVLVSTDVASVLSLGGTLNIDLTGRENALTAALLAGIRMAEARAVVERALTFAELEEFADSPVRSYSDGMKLRLAFGVVAQLNPGLLLLDEVIAVGDLRFREKCMARIDELKADGASLLFASHDLEQVAEQCDRALWLEDGVVRLAGGAEEVVESYRDATQTETLDRTPKPGEGGGDGKLILRENRFGSQEVTIEDVTVVGSGGEGVLDPDGSLTVELTIHRDGTPIENPIVAVSVHRAEGEVSCCEANTDTDEVPLGTLSGSRRIRFRWDDVELFPGEYLVDVGVYEANWKFAYDYHWHVYPLRVLGVTGSEAVFRPRRRRWTVEDAS